jgi:DNA-binding NarL/FixJ family response regulator
MDTLPSILIAEDDKNTRFLLQTMLEALGYPIAGVAADGREAVEKTVELKPDVLLLDIGMPVLDGLEAVRLIFERHPLPVVVLTGLTEDAVLEQARGLGVQAFLLKPLSSKEQLRSAIAIATAVFERQRADEERIAALASTLESTRAMTAPRAMASYGLTRRETEVLHLLAEGRSNSEIGVELGLSPRTVEKHVEHILAKLDVKSRAGATRLVTEAAHGRGRRRSP